MQLHVQRYTAEREGRAHTSVVRTNEIARWLRHRLHVQYTFTETLATWSGGARARSSANADPGSGERGAGGDNNHSCGRVSGRRLRKRAAAPVASRLPLWPSRHDRRRPRARAHAAIFEGHSPGFASRLAEHLSAAPRGRRSMPAARLRPRPCPSAPDAARPHRCIRPDPLPAHTDLLLHTSNGPSCESLRCDLYVSPIRVSPPVSPYAIISLSHLE